MFREGGGRRARLLGRSEDTLAGGELDVRREEVGEALRLRFLGLRRGDGTYSSSDASAVLSQSSSRSESSSATGERTRFRWRLRKAGDGATRGRRGGGALRETGLRAGAGSNVWVMMGDCCRGINGVSLYILDKLSDRRMVKEARRAHITESVSVAFKSIGSTSESESELLSLSESESSLVLLKGGGDGE
ncbi:hypothetical protein B0H12DRAFT_795803 [Mycena haematopus]|nr:hypothetical protein B0H12DRAFT_795803 [Mycena haematopus]